MRFAISPHLRWAGLVACTIVGGLVCGCEVGTESLPSEQAGAATGDGESAAADVSRLVRGEIQFVDGYERGYNQALREGKPMLVFFTAEWCQYCHQMAEEAFTNSQVVGLSQRFVCILVDADAAPAICRQYRVQAFPTVQFISPRGAPLNRLTGKKASPLVLAAMQAALQNIARHADSADDAVQR